MAYAIRFILLVFLCRSVLLAAPSDNDDRFLQGEPLTNEYPPAYTAPGVTAVSQKLKHSLSDHTLFFDVAFTYWYLSEDGLKFASNAVLNGATVNLATNTSAYVPSFEYEPGFKVGFGIVSFNTWQSQIGYTWAHTCVTTTPAAAVKETTPAGTTTLAGGTSVFSIDDWFLQGSSLGQSIAASSMNSTWKLTLNLIDMTTGRPYYQGKNLIVGPFGGLQAAFISQTMEIAATQATGQFTNPGGTIYSRNTCKSWGIGPRFGFDGKCLITKNFRFEGNGALDILYTAFTTVTHQEDRASTSFNGGPYTASYPTYVMVCPNASLELGIAWGQYFNNANAHFDLSLTYNFATYWNQNMLRKLLDDVSTGTSPAPANLFTEGLSLTARLDF